jgi:hypothetical protein
MTDADNLVIVIPAAIVVAILGLAGYRIKKTRRRNP